MDRKGDIGYILENSVRLLDSIQNPLEKFNKRSYPSQLEGYFYSHIQLFEEIQAYCKDKSNQDKDVFFRQLTFSMISPIQYAQNQIAKKSLREKRQIDLNLILVIYVFPVLQEYLGEDGQKLANILLEEWNIAFPGEQQVSMSTKESIMGGFKSRLCYITTATCQVLGEDENCRQLELLRDFRDRHLAKGEEAYRQVQDYYETAPTILKRIDKREDASQIYHMLWQDYILPCVEDIEAGKEYECYCRYLKMIEYLKDTYLYTSQ